jgi:predicted PolB exonuclease-like 3'-5' exonuclease
MPRTIMVFDLETRLDVSAVARAYQLAEGDRAWAVEVIGDRFPPPIFHEIISIGALRAVHGDGAWRVEALGAPHAAERSEKRLISDFATAVEKHRPRLVTFNGASFDLPVLRYRGAMHRVFAPGLHQAPYFHRYGDAAVDLCDVLASYDGRGKVSLDYLCRVWGIPGKPDTINGSQVAAYAASGRFDEIAQYCEHDVVATYKAWLRHELFAGRLTPEAFARSEDALADYIFGAGKFHLHAFLGASATP